VKEEVRSGRCKILLSALIIDEVGCFPFDELTANVFFQVVSKRYGQCSMILTSNKFYLARIEEVFGDDLLTTTILDHTITFNSKEGDFYRLQERKSRCLSYPVI
jgi:DNA replication protein DnaC